MLDQRSSSRARLPSSAPAQLIKKRLAHVHICMIELRSDKQNHIYT